MGFILARFLAQGTSAHDLSRVPAYDIDLTDPAWDAFSDEVLDRLFALNAQRAAEEVGLLATGPAPKKPAAPRKPKAKPEEPPQPALSLSLFPAPPVKPT